MEQIKCRRCGEPFLPKPRKIYCSNRCYNEYQKAEKFKFNNCVNLPTGTIGAIAELVVCADLMRMGYEVFRAMSPSSDCDILAIKDGVIHKFEVRTGNYRPVASGETRLYYATHKLSGKEIVVVTHADNKVHYLQGLPELS